MKQIVFIGSLGLIILSASIFSACQLKDAQRPSSSAAPTASPTILQNQMQTEDMLAPSLAPITETSSVQSDIEATLRALDEAIVQADSSDFASSGLSDKEIGLE